MDISQIIHWGRVRYTQHAVDVHGYSLVFQFHTENDFYGSVFGSAITFSIFASFAQSPDSNLYFIRNEIQFTCQHNV